MAGPGHCPIFYTPSFAAGYLAVTTFFVLSGFVLARTYVDTGVEREKSLVRYGVGRFAPGCTRCMR